MAISLEDKLKLLPIERQKLIKQATDELISQEYALREAEKTESNLDSSRHVLLASVMSYLIKRVPSLLKVIPVKI